MGRHRTVEEKRELGERARQLRAEGRSRREIIAELHVGDDLLKDLLHGSEVPPSLRRPRAKDDVRAAAVALRRAGASYNQIVAELGVSKSTCSLWLRDVQPGDPAPTGGEPPASAAEERRERARGMRVEGMLLREIAERLGVSVKTVHSYTWDLPVPARSRGLGRSSEDLRADLAEYWRKEKARRAVVRAAQEGAHAEAVQPLTREQLHLIAVTAYWCEGSKSKPYAVREQVTFINSDVGLLRLWLAFLDDIGFPEENRRYSVAIHESADVARATASWAADLGVPAERFGRPTLKRHNPRTVRLNTGEDYRGCVVVRLTQCVDLYRMIAGTWAGIMGALPGAPTGSAGGEAQSRVV